MQKKAAQDLIIDVTTGEDRKRQELDTFTNGYKAAVISGLIGSFEEKYWWWKVRSCEEQKTRAGREERETNTVLMP